MKIFVTGTRGIPDIPGGVEKHCQELYPRIAGMGHRVTIATRKPYVQEFKPHWQGVNLVHCHAPRKKSVEAIVHTLIAVLAARIRGFRLIHIHGIGPGLLVPFARLIGLKVVFTSHGSDYHRQKWGKFAKKILRLGEYLGGRFADQVIVISKGIETTIQNRCGRSTNLIHNGVTLPKKSLRTEYLRANGLSAGKYMLAVARFVPEKGLHDLMDAFKLIKGDYNLVIAGDADHETSYSRSLKAAAMQDERVILAGYVTGEYLNQLYTHAHFFVLPSYHEGLPIALLEAMSYGLNVLVSDIAANVEVGLDDKHYFRCGDVEDLTQKVEYFLENGLNASEKLEMLKMITSRYDWGKISMQTVEVYHKITNKVLSL